MKSIKNYTVIFLLFCLGAVLYLLYPLTSNEHFVKIEDGKFKLNGNFFYPLAINYIVSIRIDKGRLFPCPYFGYTPDSLITPSAKDTCLLQLRADMELIREMGFNTVRIVGIGEEKINKKTGELTITASDSNESDTTIVLFSEENYKIYFHALSELFKIVNQAGLKTIFLVRLSIDSTITDNHLRTIATHFKNDTNIMAYDLFNEPLYFDSSWYRTKEETFRITERWNNILKTYAPNHLSTIGLANLSEVFRWDPNMMDVDFISFHPYNHEPELVMNELYWYGHYVTKPWILGETGLPADDDSITYEEQKNFAERTLKQAYNCGATGYSWWQYKDVDWKSYMANYIGVVTRKGETRTEKGNLKVIGTPKPVSEAFKKYSPTDNKDSCICLPNYYNYSQGKVMRIIGYVTDTNNVPVSGSVVLGWNQWWNHSYHTITKKDGSFELLGTFPFYHWIASATLHSVTKGEILPDTAKTYKDNIPTINLGKIRIYKLKSEE